MTIVVDEVVIEEGGVGGDSKWTRTNIDVVNENVNDDEDVEGIDKEDVVEGDVEDGVFRVNTVVHRVNEGVGVDYYNRL